MRVGFFIIDCKDFRVRLKNQLTRGISKIYETLVTKINSENELIKSDMKSIKVKLNEEPATIEKLD